MNRVGNRYKDLFFVNFSEFAKPLQEYLRPCCHPRNIEQKDKKLFQAFRWLRNQARIRIIGVSCTSESLELHRVSSSPLDGWL